MRMGTSGLRSSWASIARNSFLRRSIVSSACAACFRSVMSTKVRTTPSTTLSTVRYVWMRCTYQRSPSSRWTSCSSTSSVRSTFRTEAWRSPPVKRGMMSERGRPMSLSTRRKSSRLAGVKRLMRSSSSRKTVAMCVLAKMLRRSPLAASSCAMRCRSSIVRVESSSLTDCISSRLVESSSLVDCISSFIESSSSLAVWSCSFDGLPIVDGRLEVDPGPRRALARAARRPDRRSSAGPPSPRRGGRVAPLEDHQEHAGVAAELGHRADDQVDRPDGSCRLDHQAGARGRRARLDRLLDGPAQIEPQLGPRELEEVDGGRAGRLREVPARRAGEVEDLALLVDDRRGRDVPLEQDALDGPGGARAFSGGWTYGATAPRRASPSGKLITGGIAVSRRWKMRCRSETARKSSRAGRDALGRAEEQVPAGPAARSGRARRARPGDRPAGR